MDPFEVLGLSPSVRIDVKEAEGRYRDLTRALHPDRHTQADANTRRAALSRSIDVNNAWRIVRDPIRRCEALAARMGQHIDETTRSPEGQDLMSMLELREEIDEARHAGDTATLERIGKDLTTRIDSSIDAFARAVEASDQSAMVPILATMRYLARLRDDVAAAEEVLMLTTESSERS